MAAAAQATAHLDRLDLIYFPDNGYQVDAAAVAFMYSPIHRLQFADDKLYALPSNAVQYFAKETLFISKLKDNLELGQKFLALLYSYRSVSRGIPQAQSQDQANRPEMYKQAYEVLKPEIRKMKDLHKYCEESTSLLATVVKTMNSSEYKDGFPSNEFLHSIAETLDMLIVIDTLKNAKASLNNDFSIYKRIWSNLKNLLGEVDDETMENHVLYTFLGTQNAFALKMKEKLLQIPAFEEILIDLVNYCAQQFEQERYVRPEEKYMLLKSLTFGLYLMDQDGEDKDINKRKRLRLEKAQKLIKTNPVVPFFGDMTMELSSFFGKLPKLSQMNWRYEDDILQKKYNLLNQIDNIRQQYRNYLIKFKATMNQFRIQPQSQEEDYQKIFKIMKEGLLLVSDLTQRVLEQSAWKFAHPTSNQANPNCPPDASLYEQAVRYNYSEEERCVLVELIGFIKSLQQLLHEQALNKNVIECLYKQIYFDIQMFSRTTLKDLILHASKKKKTNLMGLLLHLYNIMIDQTAGLVDIDDAQGTVKSKQSPYNPQQMSRSVSIASSQLHYSKVILDAMISEKSKGMHGGFLKEKDFKDSQVEEVERFLKECFYYEYMLDFQTNLLLCSDLSELWYKEFYLELTKQIQFPIEMSLPWILTDTVLELEMIDLTEYILCPLLIYNDAANKALHKLKSKFLYDEIEAEVNLCFDQFIWKLSQKVFCDFKMRASSYLLDKNFKREIEARLVATGKFDPYLSRYSTILRQKRFQLLGRNVCISKLVAQFCNQHLRQSVDIAISRFEASELCFIIELEQLLAAGRYTHTLLEEFMTLDSFDDIIQECDERMSLIGYNGRIVSHAIQELLNDFIPNYCYNSVTDRFIRATLSVGSESANRQPMPRVHPMHLYGTKNLYSAHNACFQLYKNFLGAPHFSSLIRVLGVNHFNVLLGELGKSVELMLKLNVTPYVKALIKGLPHSTKLPPVEYGSKGGFDYFNLILKPILSYRDLKSGVFQVFREVGNTILLFYKLENILKLQNTQELLLTHKLVGVSSGLLANEQAVSDDLTDRLLIKNVYEEAANIFPSTINEMTMKEQGARIHQLYEANQKLLLLNSISSKLEKSLRAVKKDWETPLAQNDLQVDHSSEFYRLFSAILFAFSIPPPSETEYCNRELFGDGFLWAGCVIIHLFDEERRFLAFDFTRFLSFVYGMERKPATQVMSGLVDLGKFFENAEFNNALIQELLEHLQFRRSRQI